MKNKILVIFTAFICYTSKADVPNSERQALIALYNSTNGPNWNSTNTNWNTSNPVNTWQGVTVSVISGLEHVTKVEMSFSGMIGNLPPEIGNLSFLNEITIFDLNGSIPVEIGNLTNLTRMTLGHNLSGNIPESIGNLVNLELLVLYNNQLTGNIPLGLANCINLKTLLLDYNHLSGNIPAGLANLTLMEEFWISGNNLVGDITNIYSTWPNLAILGIDHTLVTGNLNLSNNPDLVIFWAPENSLTSINVNNNNNSLLVNFNTVNSLNLTCIKVDNANNATNNVAPYNGWGVDNISQYSGNCTLSTNNEGNYNRLMIYPNPVQDIFFINKDDIETIEIFNTLGKMVISKSSPDGINKMNISELNYGLYYVRLKDNKDNFEIIKIMKN